jgi:hypothetical protein
VSPAEAGEGFRRLQERHAHYHVVDRDGDKIGTVEAAFVDEDNQREYLEVKGGLLGRALGTGSFLVPMELCTVNDDERIIRVSADKEKVKVSPPLDAAAEVVTREHESIIRGHYGL